MAMDIIQHLLVRTITFTNWIRTQFQLAIYRPSGEILFRVKLSFYFHNKKKIPKYTKYGIQFREKLQKLVPDLSPRKGCFCEGQRIDHIF